MEWPSGSLGFAAGPREAVSYAQKIKSAPSGNTAARHREVDDAPRPKLRGGRRRGMGWRLVELGSAHCTALLEAFAAGDWAASGGTGGDRCFLTALRA